MQRALSACFGALIIAVAICSPVSAQELAGENRPAVGPESNGRPAAGQAPTCAPAPLHSSQSPGARRRLIVTAAYCAVLRRPPDEAGVSYWSGMLADGLGPYELIQALLVSPERQARETRSFSESLSALALSPGKRLELEYVQSERRRRQEALEQRRLDAEVAAERKRVADEARLAEEQRLAEERKREARLRTRTEIGESQFEDRVAAAGLAARETVTDALVWGRLDGGGQRVTVAFVHLSRTRGARVSPANRGKATVGSWASEIGAHVAVNGNWFSPYDGPAVSNGEVYGGADHFYTALFGFTADGDAIIDHHRETNEFVDDRVVEAVSGHPTLIHRGERTVDFGGDPTFTRRNPRTAIGLDGSGDVMILVTIDGRSSSARGMTGYETAELMERLGAHDAVMLDGGGSSTMWITGRGIVNRPSGAPRAVGNQIAVYGD